MGSPAQGAKVQMQLLRSYADPSTNSLSGRLISAPSDRVGAAPLWEYFGGHNCPCGKLIWASADDYGLIIIRMYSEALAESGKAGACVPYAPPSSGAKWGRGYWLVADDGGVFTFGNGKFRGSMGGKPLWQPVMGMERTGSGHGYWLFASDGGIFSFGDAKFYGSLGGHRLSTPVVAMQRTLSG